MTKKCNIDEQMLCYLCIGDDYLKKEVEQKGTCGVCSCCGEELEGYTFEVLADIVEKVIETHYYKTVDQPHSWQLTLLADKESDYEWERDGTPVVFLIADLMGITEKSAQAIQSILDDRHSDFESAAMGEETEFSSESYYDERGIDDSVWQSEWFDFEKSLKTENRFFNSTAEKVLKNIFCGISGVRLPSGKSVIVNAGPDTEYSTICRARVFQSDEEIKRALCHPEREIGPPPAHLATAGRMNAQGISVFYGAQTVETALAEVRPPVGSQVVVAYFEIIRPLRLLNLEALNSIVEEGSLFDSQFAKRLEKAAFLRSFCKRIARPVMPNMQDFEYLPTQCVADFLAGTNGSALDGIMFPSAQRDNSGLNIVIFHKSSRVEERTAPLGTTFEASTFTQYDEGFEREYSIVEIVANAHKSGRERDISQLLSQQDDFGDEQRESDPREVSLCIIPESICVHIVKSLSIDADKYTVSRDRYEKSENSVEF